MSQIVSEGIKTVTDLSSNQFKAVKLSADFTVAAIAANTDQPYGILQNKPNGSSSAPKAAEVALPGSHNVKAEAGGTITQGDMLGVDADGDLVTAPQETGPATATGWIIAVALEDAVAGDIFRVDIITPLKLTTV